MQIKKSDYEKILKQVQIFISEAQNKVMRNNLEMACTNNLRSTEPR